MGRKKTEPKKHTISSLALSPHTSAILDRLSQDLTDYTGRKTSGSAVIRALLTYAEAQGYNWTLSTLAHLIEAEMHGGTVWGKKK